MMLISQIEKKYVIIGYYLKIILERKIMYRTHILTFDIDKGTYRDTIKEKLQDSHIETQYYDFTSGYGTKKTYVFFEHRPDLSYWNSLSINQQKDIIYYAALLARLFEYENPKDYRFVSIADAITFALSSGESLSIIHQ